MLSPVKIWRNQKKVRELLNQKGKIVSYTRVFVPPQGFETQAPYVVVIAKLKSGKSIIAQLVEFEEKDIKVGSPVYTVLRRTRIPDPEGVIPYGIKLKPLK